MERLLLCRRHMVRLTVGLHATSTRRAHDLLEALRFLGLSARLESGCLGCFSWADPDSTVHYVEEWETEASMRQQVRSDRFTSLLAVVESAQDPHVQFDFVSQTRGLDFVEEARTDAAS